MNSSLLVLESSVKYCVHFSHRCTYSLEHISRNPNVILNRVYKTLQNVKQILSADGGPTNADLTINRMEKILVCVLVMA